jgi:hypothetical protein
MRGADPAEAMASAVDRIVSAREGTGALDRAIEAVVGTIGRFSGKNATSYLEAYRADTQRCSRYGRSAERGRSSKAGSSRNTGMTTRFHSRSVNSWSGLRHPKRGGVCRRSFGSSKSDSRACRR